MKILIFILSIFVIESNVNAQIRISKSGTQQSITINQPCDMTTITTIFGNPQQEEAHEDEAAGGCLRNYTYPNLRISTLDDYLYDFAFDDLSLEVYIHDRYKIKINDSVSDFIDQIPTDKVIIRRYDDSIQLFFTIEETSEFYDSSLIMQINKSGKVISMRWYSPV